jgi:hypothetical protein
MKRQVSSLTGLEALSSLESMASIELKQIRQLVEEAVEIDIETYLKTMGAGEAPPNVLSGLSTAAIAGGQLGFTNLVLRLDIDDLKIKDLDAAANDILTLVYRHTSILNNVRLKISVVQSIARTLIGKNVNLRDKEELNQILSYLLSDSASLDQWGEDAEELFQQQAAVTGNINSRSISTYSKLWKSYLNEKLRPILGIRTDTSSADFVSERIKPLIGYKQLTSNQMKKLLLDDTKRSKLASTPKRIVNKNKSSKLIYKKDLGGRYLKITYDSPGVDPELIQPVLNSVKGQMLADPNQQKISVDMSNETSQVILELERPKKEDLATLKIQLGSIAYGL